jgi:hypothetical protein
MPSLKYFTFTLEVRMPLLRLVTMGTPAQHHLMWRLLIRVLHPLFLVLHTIVEMDPWSRESFTAYFACARL